MPKIPKEFQDYDNDDPNIDRRNNRWKYWENLRKLRAEFSNQTNSTDYLKFAEWLKDTYGFTPIFTGEGEITDDIRIVDEKKYMVYILKYG